MLSFAFEEQLQDFRPFGAVDHEVVDPHRPHRGARPAASSRQARQ